MPQIIDPGPGFGGQLGAAFGGGISSGLQALAQHKFNQLTERAHNKQRSSYLEANNIPKPIANLIASYPENQQLQALQTFGELGLLAPQNQQQAQKQQTQQLQQQAITPQEQQSVALQDVLASLNPRSQANPAQRQLQQLSGANGGNFLDNLMKAQGMTQQMGQELPEQQAAQQLQQQQPQSRQVSPQQMQQAVAPREAQPRPGSFAEAFVNKGKRNMEQEKINTEARKTENEFAAGGDIGQEIKGKLSNLRKLVNSGKTSSPTAAALLGLPKKLGVDLSSWLSPETGEITASENIFYPLIPYVIKGNVTDKKLEAFRDKLPKATDTDEVKRRKIDNIEKIVDDMISRGKASQKVAHKYGGKLPANFRELVYEQAGHKEPKEESTSKEENSNPEMAQLPDPAGYSPDTSFQLSNGDIVKIVDGQWRIA